MGGVSWVYPTAPARWRVGLRGDACGPTGVAGAVGCVGRAAWCARGRRPAREPSAPRASLGASPRSPARPRHRPRAPQPGPPDPPAPLHTSGAWSLIGASSRSSARPCRRPRAPQPGPPDPPAPLHTSGAGCADGCLGASPRSPARPRHRPRAPQPGPAAPPAPFTLVWPVVLLCLLLPHPACIRYKVRPVWLVGGDSGRKFALCGQNALNWAILGEQGEFCPAHAVRRGVQGKFCTGSGPARFLLGEFCPAAAPSVCPGAELPPPTGTAARPCGPSGALHTGGAWLPETALAIADANSLILVQFLGAVVMVVSAVPCWG